MIEQSIVHLPELVKEIDRPVSIYLVHLSRCPSFVFGDWIGADSHRLHPSHDRFCGTFCILRYTKRGPGLLYILIGKRKAVWGQVLYSLVNGSGPNGVCIGGVCSCRFTKLVEAKRCRSGTVIGKTSLPGCVAPYRSAGAIRNMLLSKFC